MSDNESDADEVQWLLGFIEDADPMLLLRHRFPSKVGGRPAWLDPFDLPMPEKLTCGVTGKPLDFLLQVYATPSALDQDPGCFHRTIFLFISPQGDQLAKPGAVKAFRSQLPRHNPYYGFEPPTRYDRLPRPLEVAAGISPTELPEDRWKVAQWEAAAGQKQQPSAPVGQPTYPEWELIVEPEDAYGGEGAADDAQTDRLIREYRQREEAEGPLNEEDLPADALTAVEENITAENRQFANFATTIAAAPDQVLRYCFEPAAVPLWPSPQNVPGAGDIPECPLCGSPRQFEFQVLPQLLLHLDLDQEADDAPDWGVIAVYTCSRSCHREGYAEEFVWVQPG